MQNAFPIPAAAGSYEKKISAEPSGFASGVSVTKKNSENNRQDAETSLFAPFAEVLSEAVEEHGEQGPSGKTSQAETPLAEDSLESALSASQEEIPAEIQEEHKTGFPLNGDAFASGFSSGLSKSVLELLSSLRGELEKEGIDLDALSKEMEDAIEENPTGAGLDTERLEAMLSALRNRYQTTSSPSGEPRRPGIDASVSESLKSRLEASLKKHRPGSDIFSSASESADSKEGGEATSEAEEAPSKEFMFMAELSVEEDFSPIASDDSAEGAAVPRFHSYLRGDAASSASSKAAKTEKTEKDGEASKGAPEGEILGQGAAVAPPAVSEGREERPDSGSGEQGAPKGTASLSKGLNKGPDDVSARSAPEDAAKSSSNEEEPGGAAQKRSAAENRVNFEQFFEGVMTRRGQSGSRAGALELGGGGTPLARDEALREGVTNVVRFVRVSGEQKASLIVDPPALGRVSVELTGTATGLEASIKVSSEQVRQLIQDQLAQLRWSLAQQGVQLTHFSVDVQQEDGGRQQRGTGQERRRAAGISGVEAGSDAQDEQAGFRVDLNQGLLYWVA